MAIIGALPVTLTNGTTADATQVMSDFTFIVSQTNANAAPLVNTPQLNAANVFTLPQTAAAAATRAQLPIYSQVQDQGYKYGVDSSGAANIITAPLTPAIPGYQDGAAFNIKVAITNTGATTLNINGVGAEPVVNPDNTALIGGELIGTRIYTFTWSATLTKFIVTGTVLTVLPALDGTWRVKNTADLTKIIADSASLITTATTRTRTMPDKDITMADINDRHGSVYLSYTSANAITLLPKNGQSLMINGVMYRIAGGGLVSGNPSAAVNFVNAVAGQALAASTVYDVYVFVNAGALTFDYFSAGTHSADATTGVEILTGSPTRSYVGKVLTNSSQHFQQLLTGTDGLATNSQLGVISWFNRVNLTVKTALATATINAGTNYPTWGELGAGGFELRVGFISFGDEAITINADGSCDNLNAAGQVYTSLTLDSATVPLDSFQNMTCDTAGSGYGFSNVLPTLPTEGSHTARILCAHSAGTTGQFNGSATAGNRVCLKVMLRG